MTSNYRISQHGMDIVFKLEAEQLGSALARRYHIDLPPVVRYFPTELPFADIHLEQLDSIFELEDERLLRLEFQSEHRGDTLPRFLVQDALLYQRHRRRLATVVIYGAGINTAADGISAGAIEYSVSNILYRAAGWRGHVSPLDGPGGANGRAERRGPPRFDLSAVDAAHSSAQRDREGRARAG